MTGWILARKILPPYGDGWTWSITINADDFSWHGEIHRTRGGPLFKTKESAERKARAVAKKLGIILDDNTPPPTDL